MVPFAVTLAPRAPAEVAELLARRYEHLRRGARFTPPVAPDVAARLYTRYPGDLRNFLRLLSRAVQQHAVTAPGHPLDEAALVALVALMAPSYRAELVGLVGPVDAAHLAAVDRGQAPEAEFRVTEAAARTEGNSVS